MIRFILDPFFSPPSPRSKAGDGSISPATEGDPSLSRRPRRSHCSRTRRQAPAVASGALGAGGGSAARGSQEACRSRTPRRLELWRAVPGRCCGLAWSDKHSAGEGLCAVMMEACLSLGLKGEEEGGEWVCEPVLSRVIIAVAIMPLLSKDNQPGGRQRQSGEAWRRAGRVGYERQALSPLCRSNLSHKLFREEHAAGPGALRQPSPGDHN